MGKTIYRTENSSVVQTKQGALFEIRRKNLTGYRIKNPKTWETKEQWLSDIGTNECTSVDYDTDLHPDAQMVLGWTDNSTLQYKKIIESTAHTMMLGGMRKRLYPIERFLENPTENFHIGYESFQRFKEYDGFYHYNEYRFTKEELIAFMVDSLTASYKSLKTGIDNILRYEFTDSKLTKVYRHQKSRDVPSILLQICSEETLMPLLPLYINKGSGLMGYNHRVAHTFQELGLEGVKVNVYEGWHSIIKPKHIGIVLTSSTKNHELTKCSKEEEKEA